MFFQKIKYLLRPFESIANIVNSQSIGAKTLLHQKLFEQRANFLTKKVFQSTAPGISSEIFGEKEIIVSLTSYGQRVYDVYLAIESIMQGTIKPNRIILWLSDEEFSKKTLPQTLQNQMKRGLEIRFCKDIKSYKKIFFSLKEFPEACIITIDDDLIYNIDLVKNLVNSHKKNPNCIWANRIHEMTFDKNKQIKSYLQWNWNSKTGSDDTKNNFFTSGGGTLFPPHSLHNEVFNEETFMAICPTADDVWLNAMARLNHTKILKSFTHEPGGDDFLVNEALQAQGLGVTNNNPINCKNDTQIKSVFEKYNILIH